MFSGYGGLDLAVEYVTGAHPAWFMEADPAPARVLAHHWPDVPNHGDVTTVDWSTTPPVDVLTAGYPCQPFSHAGHRKGTHDERHLWPHIHTAISTLRPHAVFLENVTGHLTLGFREVLADLAQIGFDAQWATLRASDVGAPHHRDRLFVVAYPNGERPQTRRSPSGAAAEVTRDYDGERPFPGPRRAADLHRQFGYRVAVWSTVVGEPPLPTVEKLRHPYGPRFPVVKPSLNPEWVEWMMGLPQGWVTSPAVGLTRAQQLKVLGNGVVPQQAAHAYTHLLTAPQG